MDSLEQQQVTTEADKVPIFNKNFSDKENEYIAKSAKKKTYSYTQVMKACIEYYNGDLLAASVVAKKYLLRDRSGNFLELTPDDMHDRLASEFARIEQKMNPLIDIEDYHAKVRALLHRFGKVVPQGSPMAAIGNPFQLQSLSNCFVIESPQDSIEGIFRSGLSMAQIQKRRGGVGVDLSTLRPMGAEVNNAAGHSSGVPCFSDFFSHITRMIGQLGRQGALMISLDIRHPDAEHFIKMKADLKKVTGANVSLRLSDSFMDAVNNDSDFWHQWPVNSKSPKIVRKVKARDLWNLIIDHAWKNGEPGLLMWDNITKNLPAHNYPGFETTSTNPCAELPLSPNDSCRLISDNLMGWVEKPYTPEASFNFIKFHEDTKIAQRMSDGLVELEIEAVEKIIAASDTPDETEMWTRVRDTARNGRRTGLGTHAFADLFLALGMRYDSEEAIKIADLIYKTHKIASYEASVDMAEERGPFPAWDWEIDKKCPFIRDLPADLQGRIKKHGRRNISNLTVAPTGSVSIASQTSSGIESNFRWVYDRRVKKTHMDIPMPVDFVDAMGDEWTNFRVIHPAVIKYFQAKGIDLPIKDSRDFTMNAEDANKKLQSLLPDFFVTSDQIDYLKGVELQATIQRHIDHGISRTINMPKGTKKEEVGAVYLKAWKLGLKGVTVYVDGSRDGVLVTDSSKDKKPTEPTPNDESRPKTLVESHAPKRPKTLPADVHHLKVHGKDWQVIVGLFDGKPYEVFAGQGLILPKSKDIASAHLIKNGNGKYKLKCYIKDDGTEEFNDLTEIYDNSEQRIITRSVCRELRHGIPIEFIAKDLSAHTGSISDYSSALSRVLKKYMTRPNLFMKSCPACGGTEFIMQEGCTTCKVCGHSKCG